MDSHAEVRMTHGRNGVRWSAHFDPRCSPAPKDVEEDFTRRSAESRRRLACSNRHALTGFGPLNLEPGSVQSPTQVVAAAANVSPQGGVHGRREAAGSTAIGSANVLVVNEQLVEIGQGADPFNAEETHRRAGPDLRDEPCEVLVLGQSGPASLGEPLEGGGQDEAGAGNEIAFSQHDVGGEIVCSPALQQCRNGRTEFVEEIAQLIPLLRVERNIHHAGGVYGGRGAAARSSRSTPNLPSSTRSIAPTGRARRVRSTSP